MPVVASCFTFSSGVVSSMGMCPGSVTARGWPVNVMTAEGSPSAPATLFTRSMRNLCPRCTPSKKPMVAAHLVAGRSAVSYLISRIIPSL